MVRRLAREALDEIGRRPALARGPRSGHARGMERTVGVVAGGVRLAIEVEIEVEGGLGPDWLDEIVAQGCDAAVGLGESKYGIPFAAMASHARGIEHDGRPWIEKCCARAGARLVLFRVRSVTASVPA